MPPKQYIFGYDWPQSYHFLCSAICLLTFKEVPPDRLSMGNICSLATIGTAGALKKTWGQGGVWGGGRIRNGFGEGERESISATKGAGLELLCGKGFAYLRRGPRPPGIGGRVRSAPDGTVQ